MSPAAARPKAGSASLAIAVRARAAVAIVLAAAASAGAVSPAGAEQPGVSPPRIAGTPERVMVRGDEFSLVLSRTKLRPGPAIIQFVNGGEDPHDLRLRRLGDSTEFGFGPVAPGEYENLGARLKKRSRYVLWCSLADHQERGMEAGLRTRKRRG